MKACCVDEARRHLKRHGQVARCDVCGALILAYDRETHFRATLAELEKRGVRFETAQLGKLFLIAKPS
ncbi:MAG: hypothetical protein K6U09_09740 [Acidobacteriia bacterium]|nr:hypothetical protein [Terriglobia bacterium]